MLRVRLESLYRLVHLLVECCSHSRRFPSSSRRKLVEIFLSDLFCN